MNTSGENKHKIPPRAARRQALICVELTRETERIVIERRQPADQFLAGVYRQHPEYGSRDRRFFSNAVFSWFRWRGWLRAPAAENIATAIALDAVETMPQLEYMLEHSRLSFSALEPLGLLTLAEKGFAVGQLQRNKAINICQLLPGWFYEHVLVPAESESRPHWMRCVQAFQRRPPAWLRAPGGQESRLGGLLTQAGVKFGMHPVIKGAFFIESRSNFDSARLPEIEIQDLASQCVGLCCDPKQGQTWWDVCAGAGGKSLHLADLMRDSGEIIATDIRVEILRELSQRKAKKNIRSIQIRPWNGADDPAPGKYFDGVLVDAPCSGIGTWHRNPDARWRMEGDEVAGYADIQAKLLEIACRKLRSGGRLVYATCTLTRSENTGVIGGFLGRHKEFGLERAMNPLTQQETGGIIWIWPWEWNSNGMFMAVMKKN